MKQRPEKPVSRRFWTALRLTGMILSGTPVLLMLVSAVLESAVSGQLWVDLFLPAELSFLTFPGMLLLAAAAVKQRIYARLSVALPVTAGTALGLCQALAAASGIASGHRQPSGLFMALLTALLLLFDRAAAAAPIAGLLSIQRLRLAKPEGGGNR